MSWAFWRRSRRGPRTPDAGPYDAAPGDPPLLRPPAPDSPRAARDHEPDEDRPRTPAFSGASPRPGGSAGVSAGAPPAGPGARPGDGPGDEPSVGDALHAVDAAGLRTDALDLVQAALDRDRPAATVVLQRLSARGADEPALAATLAVAALGDRLGEAAGYGPDEASPGTLGAEAVIAQGDLVVDRADALLRAVAPQRPRDLARFAVRLAAGMPEQEYARLAEAPSEQLALVTSVLLAQTVVDGGGDLDRLAEQLDDLLPDA